MSHLLTRVASLLVALEIYGLFGYLVSTKYFLTFCVSFVNICYVGTAMAKANCIKTYAEVVSGEKLSSWSQLQTVSEEEALIIAIKNSLVERKVIEITP